MHLPDAIERVRPSVVQVLARGVDGATSVMGTGYIVHASGFVLTAKHVTIAARSVAGLDGQVLAGLAMPELSGPMTIRSSFELLNADVVEEDPRHDLALIRLVPNPFTSGKPSGTFRDAEGNVGINGLYGLAPLSLRPIRDGESVAVSGYPSVTPAFVTTHGVVATATEVDLAEVHPEGSPEGWSFPDAQDSYLLDVAVNPGNSGGPVYLYSADVIGTCVAFHVGTASSTQGSPFSYNSGLAVAVPIKYGVELLSHHADIN